MNSFIEVSLGAYCVPVAVSWESRPWGHSPLKLSSQYTALIVRHRVERGPGEAPQRCPSRLVCSDTPRTFAHSPERRWPSLSVVSLTRIPQRSPAPRPCATENGGVRGRIPSRKLARSAGQVPTEASGRGGSRGEGQTGDAAGCSGLRASRLAAATALCSVQAGSAVAADLPAVFPRRSVATGSCVTEESTARSWLGS